MHPWKKKIVDREPIEKFIAFAETLVQPDGPMAGHEIELAEFQKEIAEVLGKDKDGNRVVNRLLVSVARKNGKTALLCLFILYFLAVEPVPFAQHYSIAADRDQAAILFHYARNIVNMTPELAGVLSITESKKLITNILNGSTFQALSSEGKSKHGKSSRMVISDETAQIDPELLSILETSTGSYGLEALIIMIGTQSPDPNNQFSEWTRYAANVNNGTIIDDTFAGFVWMADEDADIWDEKVWMACNPGMVAGFRNTDEFRKTAERAKELGGIKVAEFQNLYLNQQVDSATPFITRDVWMKNGGAVNQDVFDMYPVYGGLDLSARGDLTSLVLVCQDDEDHIHTRTYAWTPADLVKAHETSDKAPYTKWVQDNYIETVPGSSIAYDWIAHRIGEIYSQTPMIQSINFDRWRIDEFNHELDKAGIYLPMNEFGQGFVSMSPAIEDLVHALANTQLRHGSNPVLTWCVSNAVAVSDPAGNLKLAKDKSFGRIDPVIALVMAIRALRVDREHQGVSGSEEAIMFV